jgi:mRNA interferase RelE/StbE
LPTYSLSFKTEALAEWKRLTNAIQDQFRKKLAERLVNPRVPSAKLSGAKDRYKIKLAATGFRLVYEVRDSELIVVVIAVGKRERGQVYAIARMR